MKFIISEYIYFPAYLSAQRLEDEAGEIPAINVDDSESSVDNILAILFYLFFSQRPEGEREPLLGQ